jgi:selenocysteine lyase/cysteine desulfurase
MLAPLGTGFLYVRREHIPKFWPLQAAVATQDTNIRKYEEIGTAPAATRAAINDALMFHQAVGIERKAARLRYLTLRWANRLKAHPKIEMHSSLEPGQTWGMALVGVAGAEPQTLSTFLWDRYRIVVAAIRGGSPPNQVFPFQGIRVTPGIHMTLEEIDTFAGAMEDFLKTVR